MAFYTKAQKWFNKNKKAIILGGTALFSVGSYAIYALRGKGKISFEDWLNVAPTEELDAVYEKLRTSVYLKTGNMPYEMQRISRVLGERGAKEWFEKHPANLDPNFRWTDANRWE